MCKNWHSRNCDCCSYWDIISLLVVVSAAQGHCGLSSITNRIFSSSPAGKSTSTMNFSSTTTENLVCRSSSRAQSALSHQPAKNEHRQMTWPRLYTTKLVNVSEPEDGDRRRCDHVVTSDDVLIEWRLGFERYRYWVLGIGRYLRVSLLGDTGFSTRRRYFHSR